MDQPDPLSQIGDWPPYGWNRAEKTQRLLPALNALTSWHREHCPEYARVVDALFAGGHATNFDQVPYLPVRLFKERDLVSVPQNAIVKTMTSSGTSGQQVSRIHLDRITAGLQVKVLSRIVGERIGQGRLPLLVIDTRATIADATRFSARSGGVRGFSIFGRDTEFALDPDMSLNIDRVRAFMERHRGERVLLFGFTAIIWQHLVLPMRARPGEIDLRGAILIHGGGWKKLVEASVSDVVFKETLHATFGIADCCDYYGMAEQTGSIYLECERGNLHASNWSEVFARDPITFAPLGPGQSGLLQVISVLPHSYPGHSLLTEDVGTVLGVDDCSCGRCGTIFKVHGRLGKAEVRGCSDTYSG